MAASTPTTPAGGPELAGAAGDGWTGAHARQPRIHAAMPWDTTSAAPSPARAGPSATATERRDS